MGICIKGEFEGSPQWDMGYGSFYRLRKDVAYCVSNEFGQYYEHVFYFFEDYDEVINRLIKKYRPSLRVVDFLHYPDAGARLSPFKCKAVLDLIDHRADDKKLYGYTARPNECMTMLDFKRLLYSCYEKRKYLVWY